MNETKRDYLEAVLVIACALLLPNPSSRVSAMDPGPVREVRPPRGGAHPLWPAHPPADHQPPGAPPPGAKATPRPPSSALDGLPATGPGVRQRQRNTNKPGKCAHFHFVSHTPPCMSQNQVRAIGVRLGGWLGFSGGVRFGIRLRIRLGLVARFGRGLVVGSRHNPCLWAQVGRSWSPGSARGPCGALLPSGPDHAGLPKHASSGTGFFGVCAVCHLPPTRFSPHKWSTPLMPHSLPPPP